MNSARDGKIPIAPGKCTFCGHPALLKCKSCADFYCSEQCQRKDWPNHVHICFPVPALKTGSPKDVMPSGNAPKPNSRVVLTGFRSSNCCFVRSMDPDDDESYLLAAAKIDSYGKSAPPVESLPPVHSYAIAEEKGVMYRVQIRQIREDEINVIFYDRGWSRYRRLKDLRQISDEIICLQNYAYMVRLRNVSNFLPRDKMLESLSQFEDQEFKMQINGTDEEVELLAWTNGSSLNDTIEQILIELGDDCNTSYHTLVDVEETKTSVVDESKPKDQPEEILSDRLQQLKTKIKEETRVMEPPFKYKLFDLESENFSALIVDTSFVERGFIGCVALSDLDHLASVRTEIWKLKFTDEPYIPILNEYCIASYEGRRFRAKVHQVVDDNHFIVFCVDDAREIEVTPNEILPYPLHMKHDCVTNFCFIDGWPDKISSKLASILKEKLQGVTFIIDRINVVGEESAAIKSDELLDLIRRFSVKKC